MKQWYALYVLLCSYVQVIAFLKEEFELAMSFKPCEMIENADK